MPHITSYLTICLFTCLPCKVSQFFRISLHFCCIRECSLNNIHQKLCHQCTVLFRPFMNEQVADPTHITLWYFIGELTALKLDECDPYTQAEKTHQKTSLLLLAILYRQWLLYLVKSYLLLLNLQTLKICSKLQST